MSYYGWGPYVSVAEKRKKAEAAAKKLIKKGENVFPITINGKKIATTFWGQAWCEHLESFSDYENRLPRGRSYVRNGYVIHLAILKGQVEALVQGSSLYKVKITIKEATKNKWGTIVKSCSGKIESIFELLQGKLSKAVMEVITHKNEGLFPLPSEIKLSCSCPDGAYMCKHVAAVMYGVGAKLDLSPELLFTLRQVDQAELISAATKIPSSITTKGKTTLSNDSLQSIFGIEIESEAIDNVKIENKKIKKIVKKKVSKRTNSTANKLQLKKKKLIAIPKVKKTEKKKLKIYKK
jgi:uncharacterized Zn finger protein